MAKEKKQDEVAVDVEQIDSEVATAKPPKLLPLTDEEKVRMADIEKRINNNANPPAIDEMLLLGRLRARNKANSK